MDCKRSWHRSWFSGIFSVEKSFLNSPKICFCHLSGNCGVTDCLLMCTASWYRQYFFSVLLWSCLLVLYYLGLIVWFASCDNICLSISVCLSVFLPLCILYYLLIFVFIWASSSDKRFAFLVACHCALHCFVRIHTLLLEGFRLSVRHVPVLCPDEWRYDRAVFSIW